MKLIVSFGSVSLSRILELRKAATSPNIVKVITRVVFFLGWKNKNKKSNTFNLTLRVIFKMSTFYSATDNCNVLVVLHGENEVTAIVNTHRITNDDQAFLFTWLTKLKANYKNSLKELNPDGKRYIVYNGTFDFCELVSRHSDIEFINARPEEQGMRFTEFVFDCILDEKNVSFKCSDDSFEMDIDKSTSPWLTRAMRIRFLCMLVT